MSTAQNIDEMSEEEIDKMLSDTGGVDVDSLTEEEVDAMLAATGGLEDASATDPLEGIEPDKGFWATVGDYAKGAAKGTTDAVIAAGQFVDSYGAGPTRAGLAALQDDKPETGFFNTFWDKLGQDQSDTATGREIAVKAGAPTEPLTTDDEMDYWMSADPLAARDMSGLRNFSAADALGVGINFGADPFNIVPAHAVAKGIGKAGAGITKLGVKGAAAATDLATGTGVASKSVQIVGDSSKAAADAFMKIFSPTRSSDYPKLLAVAKREGIPAELLPEAVEFGDASFISRAARNRAEGVLGEEHLKRFEAGLDAVREAAERKIAKIGGGAPMDAADAGTRMRAAYDDALEDFFNGFEVTYDSMSKQMPGLGLTNDGARKLNAKLGGVEKFAKGLVKRGVTQADKTQGKQLLAATGAIRNTNGSVKQLLEAMRMIGRAAYRTETILADIPPDIKKMRDLYSSLSDAVIDSIGKNAGEPFARQLRQNNAAMTKMFGDKGVISGVMTNRKLSPEQVFQSLVVNGSTDKIRALKSILPAEEFARIKGAFLEAAIAGKRNPDEAWGFRGVFNQLRNRRSVIKELFAPGEFEEFVDIVRLGDAFGNPVLSSPGTGASNIFRNITQAFGEATSNDSIIESLKARGRGKAPLMSEMTPAARVAPEADRLIPRTEAKPLIPGRTRPGQIIKAGQVVGVQQYERQQYEGYPVESLGDVMPEEIETIRSQIKGDPRFDVIERAKRLNLLHKHGKAVFD